MLDRTIPELDAMGRAWRKTPPLPSVVAGLLEAFGAKSAEPETEEMEMPEADRKKFDAMLRSQLEQARASGVVVPDIFLMDPA